jgi:formate C-acetyltransferase
VEPTSDGNTFGCTSGNDISFTAALEMTLCNGTLRIMGRRIGPRTGDSRTFGTFEQLMTAYKKQVAFMIDVVARAVNLKDQAYEEGFPNPLVSATLEGCVDSARDMTAGGSRYNFGSISGRGLGTTVDSLAAIRHFVYETGELTLAELLQMLERNFRGYEAWRQRLWEQGPRYGADDDRADAIAREVAEFFCRLVAVRQTRRGGPFRPSFFSYGMHVFEGLMLGATPNGRRAGEPVSNSFSPANGSERNGLTAMLQSVAKIDHRLISNGCALNVKLQPSMFDNVADLGRMVGLVKGFFSLGGLELSPNVVDNATLRDAQLHPENHRDLVVRVSGYSAYFTDLGKPLQDEIIQRTAFSKRD